MGVSIETGWETPIQTCATKGCNAFVTSYLPKVGCPVNGTLEKLCSSWESEHSPEAGICSKDKSIGMNITRRRVGMDICKDVRRKDNDARLWFVSETP